MKDYVYVINGIEYEVKINQVLGDRAMVEVNGKVYQVDIKSSGLPFIVAPQPPAGAQGRTAPQVAPAVAAAPGVNGASPQPVQGKSSAPAGTVKAPMPGTVTRILVGAGDEVSVGSVLLIIEAMKMENEIKATAAGRVEKVLVHMGDNVGAGSSLLIIA